MHRSWFVLFLATLGFALAACSTLSSASDQDAGPPPPSTFSDHGVSFTYPPGWQRALVTGGLKPGHLWAEAVAADADHGIAVAAVQLAINVDRDYANEHFDLLDQELRSGLGHVTGLAGPGHFELDQMPVLRYFGSTEDAAGPRRHAFYAIFDGDIEFFFDCYWAPAAGREAELISACDAAINSFRVL